MDYERWKREVYDKLPPEEQRRIDQASHNAFVEANVELVQRLSFPDLKELVETVSTDRDPTKLKFYDQVSYVFTENDGKRMAPEAKFVFLILAKAKLGVRYKKYRG